MSSTASASHTDASHRHRDREHALSHDTHTNDTHTQDTAVRHRHRTDREGRASHARSGAPAPDRALLGQARTLRARAVSMRQQASGLPEILADSYRRRAAELELEAWIAEVQSGIPYDEVHPAA